VTLVREQIGPVASYKLATAVERLPRTRSGEVLRSTMRKIADRQPFTMAASIDDAAILTEIAGVTRA